VDGQRRAAYLAAYGLFEAVQGERHQAALAALPDAIQEAKSQGWDDVAFVLAAAGTVHGLSRAGASERTRAQADTLVARGEELGAPALLAIALGLRAIAWSLQGDSARLLADASRAVALLDEDDQPAIDRCTGLVVAAAAFNTLQLWELVDELYTRAVDLEQRCEVPVQAAAIAVNRVITRLEWALALLEHGDENGAQRRLAHAVEAVAATLTLPLPDLWRRDVEAGALVIDLLRGADPVTQQPMLSRLRRDLAAAEDIEILPLLDAATVLATWRHGDDDAATESARTLVGARSASSGARSFPFWVRALVLAGRRPTEAVDSQRDHAAMLGRLRWESRHAVLAAARAHIAAERRKDEHDELSVAVQTDPLTGLNNRRPFDAWLDRGPARARPSALLLVDLDGFKAVNDTFGHDVGDRVLRRVGRLLLDSVRPGDLAVRLGGDEFALLLEDEHLTLGAARERAADLLDALAAEPWSLIAVDAAVSASVGMAVDIAPRSLAEGHKVDPLSLYRAADTALYTAKRDGSRLVVAGDDTP
jgi:diguanylate cyclase (GGDEF)-like protein